MFNFIAKHFSKATLIAAPRAMDDLPSHKGFTAQVRIGAMVQSVTFQTLKEVQIWIAKRKEFAKNFALGCGSSKAAARAYSIRNLETGKFAPYKWTLTRADMVA